MEEDGLADADMVHNAHPTRLAALFAGGTALAFLLPASRIAAWLPAALAIVQLLLFAAPYLMETTLRFVRSAAAVEGVRLGLISTADPDRLEQVFINLLINARDAVDENRQSPDHPVRDKKITIKTESAGNVTIFK